MPTKKTHRIQVKRRRFAFQIGATFVGLKEYRCQHASARLLSFVVDPGSEREPHEIRGLLRAEILKRIGGG